MKRIVLVFSLLFISSGIAFSQVEPIDEEALLRSIDAVIEDTAKVNALIRPLGKIGELNPVLNFQISLRKKIELFWNVF